jgi:GNAT superfamily N-acetyltransferase
MTRKEIRAANDDDTADRMSPTIRPIRVEDREWLRGFVRERWGDEIVVAHGVVYRPDTLPGIVATDELGDIVGLLTYAVDGEACEIVTVDAMVEGRGVGSLLIDAVVGIARGAGCSRLWLITTNDNVRALGFYATNGFDVVAVHEGAVDASRKLKPSIPFANEHGVPIQDEIEMERRLSPDVGGNLLT